MKVRLRKISRIKHTIQYKAKWWHPWRTVGEYVINDRLTLFDRARRYVKFKKIHYSDYEKAYSYARTYKYAAYEYYKSDLKSSYIKLSEEVKKYNQTFKKI